MSRSTDLLIALTALTLGGVLIANHPFGLFFPAIAFLLYTAFVFYQPSVFLLVIPALLPIIGFAPWTGWITFEELDLLILASATGGYARHACDREQVSTQRVSLVLLVLATLMSASVLISMFRGFSDAGGFVFGWFQGYDGPMNSVRIGKSFFLALLLAPLISRLQHTATNTSRKLAVGAAIGLGTASLAALWERLAFTDLLNFSSDYRTTALFWEMHVGGAALDGWLLLTVPFSIWALRNARSTWHVMISLGLILLAGYASLTTFSRGVYLALIVALPLLAFKNGVQQTLPSAQTEPQTSGMLKWMLTFVLLYVLSALVFPGSGYRGLLALTGLIAVSLSMNYVLRQSSRSQLLIGIFAGVMVGSALIVVSRHIPKGPYLIYALLLVFAIALLYWSKTQTNQQRTALGAACYIALILSTLNVASHWGGAKGLLGMGGASSIILFMVIWGTLSTKPLWPNNVRWQANVIAAALTLSAVVAVFSGGVYMEDRFSTTSKDFKARISHWTQTLSLLQTPWDLAFGKGLGRFPANYYFAVPNAAFPGTYHLNHDHQNAWLSLVGSRFPMSFGDIFRISQRLDFEAHEPFEVRLKLRATTDVSVHVEICEKHLLYAERCAIGRVETKATNGEWRSVAFPLVGSMTAAGSWHAPRLMMFSLGVSNQSGQADIDDVELSSYGRSNILHNGDFGDEMQHWFFSSDRNHMPWHAKNLFVSLAFDQGIAGLTLFALLTLAALWRLAVGKGRNHELSSYLAAAIVGFLVVGMFDSLIDVPRLAFFYYLLIFYSLALGYRKTNHHDLRHH